MRSLTLAVVLLCGGLALCPAEDLAPVLEQPTGSYSFVALQFSCTGLPANLSKFASWTYRGGMRDNHMPMGDGIGLRNAGGSLQLEGSKLSGTFTYQAYKSEPAQRATITVSATVDALGVISGTCTIDGIAGTVSGQVSKAEDLRSSNPIPKDASWPTYLGPHGGGLAASHADSPLLSDPRQAQFRWVSEPTNIGMAIGSGSRSMFTWGDASILRTISGSASPVLAEGRVFLSYYVPSSVLPNPRQTVFSAGHKPFEEALALMASEATLDPTALPEYALEKIWEAVDDVMVALDAETGEILWRSTVPNRGYNRQHHKEGPFDLSPAVFDGRVFSIGMRNDLYARSASTGELQWWRSLGGANGERSNTSLSASVIAVPGVVLAPSGKQWKGFAASDGAELWTTSIPFTASTLPLWKHQGTTYVLGCTAVSAISNADPKSLICVNSATGAEVWRYALQPAAEAFSIVSGGRGLGPGGMTVFGDYLIAYTERSTGTSSKERTTNARRSATCWKLSLEGPQFVWEHELGSFADFDFIDEHVPVVVHRRYVVLANLQVLSLETGAVIDQSDGLRPNNGGYMQVMGDQVLVRIDGTHGGINYAVYQVSLDGDISNLTPAGAWVPPANGTTSYHHPIMYPIADGRVFVRIAEGVGCLDFRQLGDPIRRAISLDIVGRALVTAQLGNGPEVNMPAVFSDVDGRQHQRIRLGPRVQGAAISANQ